MLLPERVVWYVEKFMIARLQGDAERAGFYATELGRRALAAGMVIPPWEAQRITGEEPAARKDAEAHF